MARSINNPKTDTRTARLNLQPRREPYWSRISMHLHLGYRRLPSGSGSWIARFKTSTGRQFHAIGSADDYMESNGQTVLTFDQAQEKAREWHRELGKPQAAPAEPLTVSQAIDRYLTHIEAEGRKSVPDLRQRAALWIMPAIGKVLVSELKREQVEALRKKIADSEPRRKGMTRDPRARKATANRVLAILKAALTWAVEDRQMAPGCSTDAWSGVKPYRAVEEPRQDYLTPDQQVRLLNAIDDPDFRDLVAAGLATGCRFGELARMLVRDFDPTGAGSVLVREAKSGKPRRVVLAPEGKRFFIGLTAGRPPQERMFLRTAWESRRRKGLEPVRREWRDSETHRPIHAACEAAKLPKMGFHQLRHSYASALVAAGMPLALVASLTGHSDTRILERHYAHLAPDDVSRALEAMAPTLGLPERNVQPLDIKQA